MNKVVFKVLLIVGIIVLASGMAMAEEIKLTTIMPPSSSGGFTNCKVFNVVDSGSSWAVPAGVTKFMVETWGGGGGGYLNIDVTSNATILNATGGGAGGYCKAVFNVTSVTSFNITVGKGGQWHTQGTYPDPGGHSNFGTLVTANGGGGGSGIIGGSGGSGSIDSSATASVIIIGGVGGMMQQLAPNAAFAMGGSAACGGGSATVPGGGGCGSIALNMGGDHYYGSGGDGMVIVWW